LRTHRVGDIEVTEALRVKKAWREVIEQRNPLISQHGGAAAGLPAVDVMAFYLALGISAWTRPPPCGQKKNKNNNGTKIYKNKE